MTWATHDAESRPPQPSAAAPLVLGLILLAAALVLSAVSGVFAWDPGETCAVRGTRLGSQEFLGTALCVDGSAVQPTWMTVSAAAALVAASVCITIAIARRARRGGRETPPTTVSHRS